MPGIVFAQDAINMRRRQDLPNDIKHGGVVQGVTDFLQLVKQALQHATLNSIGGHKIEDQAIMLLAIAVNTAHALLKSVRIPGNVIVEQDMAALQVDPFASHLGGHQDLNGAVSELLLGEQPRPRLISEAWPHAAMDGADTEAPGLQTIDEIVERVLEFGEEQQPLFGIVEETLGMENLLDLALPLKGQVGRTDDEEAFHQAPEFQLTDEQSSHNGLAGTCIIGQEEAHAGEFEQVIIDRFKLVWQWIDAGDGEPEIRVKLVGDPEHVGLEPQAQEATVTGVGGQASLDHQSLEIATSQGDFAEALRLYAHQANFPDTGTMCTHCFHPHRLTEERPGEDVTGL
jgi:hypothetical protein